MFGVLGEIMILREYKFYYQTVKYETELLEGKTD